MTVPPASKSTRLQDREDFKAETSLRPTEVATRLRDAIQDRRSIEIDPRSRSRRRLSGSIDGTSVRLTVHDDNFLTRKKSWNIEFTGEVDKAPLGSVLHGSIEVPDRNELRILVRLFGVGAVLAVVIAMGLAVRTAISGASVDLGPTILSLVVSAVAVIGFTQMKKGGETGAAVDAKLLEGCVRRLLRVEDAG